MLFLPDSLNRDIQNVCLVILVDSLAIGILGRVSANESIHDSFILFYAFY